jgi:hypothetical protein
MGIGMGALDPDRKYVVLFEIYGPATKSTGDAFDADLKFLLTQYGGLIKHTWRAAKAAVDPVPSTLGATRGRRVPKPKPGGRRRPNPRRPSTG